ncbi:hypothetical protein MINTM005_32490 [Mycobacterium intracellulare]|uniref:Uncharacterized protein n=1 Tax=Mycobacterium paraintracellulare TaxID=1138383 RepID=A0ABN6AVT7_9MYCO|nr:hypothetical protein MPRI_50230 [Mycobacterium paraintracellulare]BCO58005.1 hypothetical protein MINTM005_32490 [Mycobacterium intracellulare]BCO95182.1 hypothetical protein MINTM016_31580 [Mycobacterium intracellulare]
MYDAEAMTPPKGSVNADGMKLTLTRSGGCVRPRTLRSSACTGKRWCWIASSIRVSTCLQKAATVDCGEALNTSGTTPATIPGSVFCSGRTRRLTGKSSTTSEPSADHPRTSSAQAAVMTDVWDTAHASQNRLTRRSTAGSRAVGADGHGSRSVAPSGGRWWPWPAGGRFAVQYASSSR